ncbi:hypothetical protein ACWCQL_26460 [Streptomyces sp. NPDC002073]
MFCLCLSQGADFAAAPACDGHGGWEDPATRRITERAIFLRPDGGGTEWIVTDVESLTRG